MNNRRDSLLIASAKTYCKCVSVNGKTIKYNQMVSNGDFGSTSDWYTSNVTFSVSNNVATMLATAQNGSLYHIHNFQALHKYYFVTKLKTTSATTDIKVVLRGDIFKSSVATTDTQVIEGIYNCPSTSASSIQIRDARASGWGNIYIYNVQFIDLTAIFGENNEPQTIEDFYATDLGKWLNNVGYLSYTNGSLQYTRTPLFFQGANIWNETWEKCQYNTTTGEKITPSNYCGSKNKIKVFPNTRYWFISSIYMYAYVLFYDKQGNYISYVRDSVRFYIDTPANCYYITFYIQLDAESSVYRHSTCIKKVPIDNINYENYCGRYLLPENHNGFSMVMRLRKGDIIKTKQTSVECNQFLLNGNFVSTYNWNLTNCTLAVSNNIATITPTSNHSAFRQFNIPYTIGHKVFYTFDIDYKSNEKFDFNCLGVGRYNISGTGNWQTINGIITVPSNANGQFNIYDYDDTMRSPYNVRKCMIIDLTALFGEGNEPSTLSDLYLTELGKLIQKGYYLDYSSDNTKFMTQLERTMKYFYASDFEFSHSGTLYASLAKDKDIKASTNNALITNALSTNYASTSVDGISHDEVFTITRAAAIMIRSANAPTGQFLIEVNTPVNYLELYISVEDGTQAYKSFGVTDLYYLDFDFKDYGVVDIVADTGNKWLTATDLYTYGDYGDYAFEKSTNRLYVKSTQQDIEETGWEFTLKVDKIPTLMINRNAEKCYDANDIELDFTKE